MCTEGLGSTESILWEHLVLKARAEMGLMVSRSKHVNSILFKIRIDADRGKLIVSLVISQ